MGLIPVVLSLLAVQVNSYTCPKTHKYIANPGNTKCYVDVRGYDLTAFTHTGTGTKRSCSSAICCTKVDNQCHSKILTYSCDSGNYYDISKAYAGPVTDAAAYKTTCCSTKAKCTDVTCAAGYKKLSTTGGTCVGNAASCATELLCCIADTKLCRHTVCGLGYHVPVSKYGNTPSKTDATTRKAECCDANAKCSGYSGCLSSSGYKLKDTNTCVGEASKCSISSCCTANLDICGSLLATKSFTCPKGKGILNSNVKNVKGKTTSEQQTNCCSDIVEGTCDTWKNTVDASHTAKTSAASAGALSVAIAAVVAATMVLV